MKRSFFLLAAGVFLLISTVYSQDADLSRIDIMIVKGQYSRVIDTCKLIIAADSMNAEAYYKMGLAWQNIIPDEKSAECFSKAAELQPENNLYMFTLAKSYFNKDKKHLAKPLLKDLLSRDTLNWTYAYYLTSIYLEEGRFGSCIDIYNRFYRLDSSNYLIYDKLGYAFLRQGKVEESIRLFNRSLEINPRNINAIKNLSFLYPYVNDRDTAIVLLTRAIRLDPEDMDLYARRATLYFSLEYTKRALDDYMKIMSTGDTSFLYLKRVGIGYTNNLQPDKAIPFLLKAHSRDTSDYETMDYLARCYKRTGDTPRCRYWYNKIINVLEPVAYHCGVANVMLAEEYKSAKMYDEALERYRRSKELTRDASISLMIANVYDEQLNNIPRAISAYKQFLTEYRNGKRNYTQEHIDNIRARVKYLEEKLAKEADQSKATTEIKK